MVRHAKISRHHRMFKTLTGLSATCEGKKHDKKLADEQALRFPKGSKLWKDTGFQAQERLPHRGMAQGGMNPETETEKLRAGSRAYLR
jgi:hypothetical protein